MPDDTAIRKHLMKDAEWSKQNVSYHVGKLEGAIGSRTYALYVLAFEHKVPLQKYGVDDDTMVKIAKLSRGRHAGTKPPDAPSPTNTGTKAAAATTPRTRAQLFAARDFHHRIVVSSRKAFNSALGHDAVRRAFQSANNRVKKLSSWSGKDGMDMMGKVFRPPPNQMLQMSDLTVDEELDEHNGLRFLMQGAMLGIRNTRSHPDTWEPDEDDDAVLELLGFASWLHRCLDRCEEYAANQPEKRTPR
jgi:uncharacterized protein (TIGR02391 family)